MRKALATFLSAAILVSACACSKKDEKETTADPSSEVTTSGTIAGTTVIDTSTDTTADTTSDTSKDTSTATAGTTYIGPPRQTEAPDYGDSKTSEICELMKSITGIRVATAKALVEDYFKSAFVNTYVGLDISYEEDPKGEEFYRSYCYMKVSSDDLEFNKFIFVANEEYGNVHEVYFINSNAKNTDNSLDPSDLSQEEMQEYYSKLEQDLTGCFGPAADSKAVDKAKPYAGAYAEFKVDEDCTFRLEYSSHQGNDLVQIICTNSAERKHFIGDTDHTDPDIGKMYDKEAKPEDIVTDEKTGRTYVKNQLLVSFTMGTPDDWEKMESICKEIDAEIVGYIELTSDFQIEFNHDMTYEELEELAKKLEDEYYFIIDVSLNHAMPMQTND